jgi:hypothetical protein
MKEEKAVVIRMYFFLRDDRFDGWKEAKARSKNRREKISEKNKQVKR